MFLTTCTLLPPTFIQPHTRNHSLTRLGLYILTDTQHKLFSCSQAPPGCEQTHAHTQAEQGAEPSSSHTHTRAKASESSEISESALPGLLLGLGLGSRLIRVRVTRVRANRVRVNRARVS